MSNNEDILYWLDQKWLSPSYIKEFEFANPEYFWLLAVIPFLFAIRAVINHYFNRHLEIALLPKDIKFSFSSLLRFIPPTFFILSLFALVIALARPQKSDEKVNQWSEGIDIMLVMDISQSMEGMDLKPNRLSAAKGVATKFINGRFQDRIGLVIFAGEAYSKSPLTSDYELLNQHVSEIEFDDIPVQGTAIGSSLAVAVNRLQESKAKSKVIILLSDGDNNAGNLDPISAAKLAYSYNIKVYTIGVGKDGKVPYNQKVSYFGQIINRVVNMENNLNETDLKNIANVAEGKYFRATNNKALGEIFEKIDEYEKSEIKEERYKTTKDYYEPYLYWALTFLSLWLFTKSTFLTNALVD